MGFYLKKMIMLNSLVISKIKHYLRKYAILRHLGFITEIIIWGSKFREKILTFFLFQYYKSQFRRDWVFCKQLPHFENHQNMLFEFGFNNKYQKPFSFYGAPAIFQAGFFNREVMRSPDIVLDIGCGDGFFTKRFYADHCAHIDAIDIEPKAINFAHKYHNADNITYYLSDAVKNPFPKIHYDVVIWDGAIGHFSKESIHQILQKISKMIISDGLFLGYEAMGIEGNDHLYFFQSVDDYAQLFKPYFKYIQLKKEAYPITGGRFMRQEVYWRCSNSEDRLNVWQQF